MQREICLGYGNQYKIFLKKSIPGRYRWWRCWGNTISESDWGNFCVLVHTGVSDQIHCISSQGLRSSFKQCWYFHFQGDFVLSSLNIIDVLGILPFYLSQILNRLSSEYSMEYIAKAAQIFRILRILRIFKLSRHITGLKTLGYTLRNSQRCHES